MTDVMLMSFLIISKPPFPPPANINHQIQSLGLSNLGSRHGVYVKLNVISDDAFRPTFAHKLKVCLVTSVDPETSEVTSVEVAGARRECRDAFVSTATLFRLISDHYECSEARYGGLRGDWEKFEVWVQKSAVVFNVNERVSREVGERCSAMMSKEDYGSPGRERKKIKREGRGEEVSPLVERGGEMYCWIKEPIKV
ncbi:hypothetical protein TrRE_jg669 [Triparma retinervis]|uniref:Uncharacterized protein n=1 Tax=Triparma retinervis TaxID=2557542 RepID=A0A9W7AUM6_9STRA|nr:hypothetical protein TrRE_jg669 [Triparma retinervis]